MGEKVTLYRNTSDPLARLKENCESIEVIWVGIPTYEGETGFITRYEPYSIDNDPQTTRAGRHCR